MSPFGCLVCIKSRKGIAMTYDDLFENIIDEDYHHGNSAKQVYLPKELTNEVIRYYSPMVYRIALTKTKSSHDADDIFQDVFLKLAMNEKSFETEEHRKAWIIRVTINCCNSHFVAPWRKNVSSLDDALAAQLMNETYEDTTSDDEPDVYAQVLKLPEQMREVILLFYYEEMSIREIAQALQTSEVNVKKRLSRARQKLKLQLEQEDEE